MRNGHWGGWLVIKNLAMTQSENPLSEGSAAAKRGEVLPGLALTSYSTRHLAQNKTQSTRGVSEGHFHRPTKNNKKTKTSFEAEIKGRTSPNRKKHKLSSKGPGKGRKVRFIKDRIRQDQALAVVEQMYSAETGRVCLTWDRRRMKKGSRAFRKGRPELGGVM